MSYPKWKFKGAEKQLVQTPDDEKALGKSWGDAPGAAWPVTDEWTPPAGDANGTEKEAPKPPPIRKK